jgi:hypothetical protein
MSVQIFQWQSQLALAKNALISGDYLTAEEYLNAAMTYSHDENAPEDAVADIFYHRGICFENKDRFVDARRAFNQAQHTFSRCLGATSSQALKAGKAKCFVDIKMGRTKEAQHEFDEIIELLKRESGDFAAEISAMETEMRDMLAHPESPDIPGTEVEIEPYAESWTPVRRPADNTHLSVPDNNPVPQSFEFQKTSTHTPFAHEASSQPAAFGSKQQQAESPHAPGNGASSGQGSSQGFEQATGKSTNQSPAGANRKQSIPSEVSDAIAHLSRSGQMAAVPESYLTGGVTGRLTVDPAQLRPPIEPGTHSEHDRDPASKEEAARKAEEEEHSRLAEEMALQAEKEEKARVAAEEAARKAEEDEIRLAAALALRMAEEEEARQVAEEAARKAQEERNRLAEEAEKARIAEEEAARKTAEEAAHKAQEEEKARIAAAEEAARKAEEEEEQARILAEEAARKTEEEEKSRIAAEEAAHKAAEEEKSRIAAEEAAHKAAEEEKSRIAAEEAAHKAVEEEKSRIAAEEAAHKAVEEEKSRIAAEEAAKKADEEKSRATTEEAAKKADEEKSRATAEEAAKKADEEKARAAAEEAAKKADEEKARLAAEESRKAEEEEKERVRVVAEEASRKSEEQKKLSFEAAQKTEEEARLEAEETARKADEEARAAAAAARKAAEEEARIASAEAARKAREGKARIHFDAEEEDRRTSALSVDFEFDNSLALTSPSTSTAGSTSAAKNSPETPRESWVPPPMSAANAKAAPQTDSQSGAQTSEPDVKVRIVRSQPEAYASKRPDGTMIDLAALQPPTGAVVPPEPNLSIVTAQNQYLAEANRRKDPPVKPDGQPERRASILSQVAEELTGQIAGKIESESADTVASDVATSLAAQVSEVAHAAEHLSSTSDKPTDLQARAHASKLAGESSSFQAPSSYESPAVAPVAKTAASAPAPAVTPAAAIPAPAATPAATPAPTADKPAPAAIPTTPTAPTASSIAPTAHNLPKLNSFSSTQSGAFATLATSGAHAIASASSLKPTTTSSPPAMPAPVTASNASAISSQAAGTPTPNTAPSTAPTSASPPTTSPPSSASASPPTAATAPAPTAASTASSAPTPSQASAATPPSNSEEALAAASSKAAAKKQALSSAPLHTSTILDMPARTFNRTMMDMGAAEQEKLEFAPQESLSSPPSRTPLPEPNEGEDKFEKIRTSGSRPGRTPAPPVSAQKSLITPRHFIRPLNIPELTTPAERTYTQSANIAAVVIYGLSVICLVGIVLVPLIVFISHVLDGIRLGRMRGNGIKVTPEQFPEVFEAVHNLAASLGMQTAPETYVMNKPGVLSACAKNYHQRDYVIIYTDVLELAYSFGESELAFVISHELAHIQCGHLKRKWLDLPAKLVPFLWQALSRAREYTCDRIAQELVPEGASMGLVALSVGTKLFRRINLKALYAQQDSVDDFWSSLNEAVSSKPSLNSRIRALAPGEDRNKSSKSTTATTKKR